MPLRRLPNYLRTLCVALAFTAGGCTTLGPDYEEPDVEWLAEWQPDLYGHLAEPGSGDGGEFDFWWQSFQDPALNELIEQAKSDNLSLRLAGLRILESRARLGLAGSALYPQLQQVTAAASYVNTRDEGGAQPDSSQSLSSYQAGFDFGWELDFWGRFRRGVESADAAYFASLAAHKDVQVLLYAEVVRLYYSYRTLQLRIAIAQRSAAIQKRSFDITRQIYESGQNSELDLQQAKTQYLATLATIPELESALVRTRNALAGLLGRPPGELPGLADNPTGLPRLQAPMIGEVPAHLLMRRPDVRAAAWQVAAQSAQIGVSRADYYPAITLFGTIGLSGNSVDGSPTTSSLVAGPALTWNIFDYGRIRNNVRIQDARLEQAIVNFQSTALAAAREIDDAAIGVLKTREQYEVLQLSEQAAGRALELANTRYREGYSDFQRVLDAQRAFFAQSDRALASQGSHISAVIDLYKALGGGWQDTPVNELLPDETRDSMEQRSDWGELMNAPLPAANDYLEPVSGGKQDE
jgi:NodT family efflux transporter outer membrane factor (OMF) lipoprotein